MSLTLPSSDLDKLKCNKCNHLLSIPPVTFSPSGGFLCGRCSSDRDLHNVIYEILAENHQFPCRYESNGCKEKHYFRLMKTHETICTKRPYLCPLLPVGKCLWRGAGDEIFNHMKNEHSNCLIDTKLLELNLSKNVESCRVFVEDGVCFLLRLVYYKAKGLMVELLEVGINFRNFNEYEIHLHSRDFKKTVKLSARFIHHYTKPTTDEQSLVDGNVLSFVTNETIFIEINFTKPTTKINKPILALLECPVCMETMTNLIYQCKTGHSFCANCVEKLANCPICKQELTNTFNYVLMALSSQLYHPCRNEKVGCNFEGRGQQLKQHEMECFRYDCPLKTNKTCMFNGNKTELFEHCLHYHEHLKRENYNVKWSLKAMNATIVKVICAYGNVFKSCRKFTGNELLWNVEFCGRDEEANKYTYTIEFELDRGRKLAFTGVCSSVGDESRVFDDCLSLPFYQLEPFVSNHVCRNNIYIKKK